MLKGVSFQQNNEIDKHIQEVARKEIERALAGSFFTAEKYTDTPTDNLSVVNRRYTNMNGTVANRPPSSVATIGQFYFATDTNIPMRFNGTNWVNGVGSVVALN